MSLEQNQELRSKDALIEKLLIEKRELQRVFTEELAKSREIVIEKSTKAKKTRKSVNKIKNDQDRA